MGLMDMSTVNENPESGDETPGFGQFEGHDKCLECGNIEIPMSSTDGGEVGLTDYFFSCAECHSSWYVAKRTEEHEEGPSIDSEDAGWFYGEKGDCGGPGERGGCHLCEDDEDYHIRVIEEYAEGEE